jgi:hypothetical protein
VYHSLAQRPPLAHHWGEQLERGNVTPLPEQYVRLSLLQQYPDDGQEKTAARRPAAQEETPGLQQRHAKRHFSPYHRILIPGYDRQGKKKPWKHFKICFVTRSTAEKRRER